MPSYARKDIVAEGEVGIYHCVNRCVRRAWLCGKDPVTGRSFEHRKQWIRDRLEELAAVFGLDVLGFAVMSLHICQAANQQPSTRSSACRWRLTYRP